MRQHEIARGQTHALMGPNGSGKSTLGFAVMGHPDYEVTGGRDMVADLCADGYDRIRPRRRSPCSEVTGDGPQPE